MSKYVDHKFTAQCLQSYPGCKFYNQVDRRKELIQKKLFNFENNVQTIPKVLRQVI